MEYLYGNHLKMLKFINKKSKNNKTIPIQELANNFNLTLVDTQLHLKKLYDYKYINFMGLNNDVKITPDGISYFKMIRSERIKIILNSVIFPIIVSAIVSIITSLITWWITYLSQQTG